MKTIVAFFILFASGLLAAFAQKSTEVVYRSVAYGSVSSGTHTPFWMSSHTWGVVPLTANGAYVEGEISYKKKLSPSFSWKAGGDLVASTNHVFNTVWLQQLFAEATWKKWSFRFGPKENYTSFLNESLSSGDFILSNNARPIPEANLSLTDFVLVPFSKGRLYFRGDAAFGKLLDGNYVENKARPNGKDYLRGVYSHHKSVYFRFGNFEKGDKSRLTFGMQHYAFFEGYGVVSGKEASYPMGFSDLLRIVFIAKEGGPNEAGEYKYKAGSHFGAYTVKFDYLLPNRDQLSTYWHHFIEDGSSAGPQSMKDMLLGVEYASKKEQLVSRAVLEYVYTKDQSGSVHFNVTMDAEHQNLVSRGNGMDDYYDNVQYIQGPSYYGRSFGTPLFLSPEYNTDGTVHFKSNRIIAFHGAMEGYLSNNLSYRLRSTYGETWGRYKVPFVNVRKGVASSFDLTYHHPKVKGLDFQFSMAFNSGRFFDDKSFGTGISIIKRGGILKK